MAQGYDITGIGPGFGDGGGAGGAYTEVAAAAGAQAVAAVHGWSLQNTFAGLSTVYIRLGSAVDATPYIAINLAENETVTQIFEGGINLDDGYHLTVEVGTVDGIIYTR